MSHLPLEIVQIIISYLPHTAFNPDSTAHIADDISLVYSAFYPETVNRLHMGTYSSFIPDCLPDHITTLVLASAYKERLDQLVHITKMVMMPRVIPSWPPNTEELVLFESRWRVGHLLYFLTVMELPPKLKKLTVNHRCSKEVQKEIKTIVGKRVVVEYVV